MNVPDADAPVGSDSVQEDAALVDAEQAIAFAAALKQKKPWMTYALLLAIGAVFGLEIAWGNTDGAAVGRMGAAQGQLIARGDWWRLLSPAFLHLSIPHVVVNGIALLSLGTLVEVVLGPRRMLVAFVVAAAAGNLLVAIGKPLQMVAGASGGLWGLMTLTAMIVLRPKGLLPEAIARRMRPRVWRALGLNVLISLIPGISLLAHFGGGIAGFALSALPAFRGGQSATLSNERPAVPTDPPSVQLAALLCGGLAVASIVVGIVLGRPWELRRAPELTRTSIGTTGLSLDLPRGLRAAPAKISSESKRSVFTYGTLAEDPIAVAVVVTDLSARIGPDETQALEEVRRGAAEELEREHATPVGVAPYVIHPHDHPAVVWDANVEGTHRTGFYAFAGERLVHVLVATPVRAPAQWRDLAPAIYESLQDSRAGTQSEPPP